MNTDSTGMETAQTKTLSPGDLAEIIGVSESSIRRWVDDGRIGVMRTAGGHRRIQLSEALRFIRENELKVMRPDLVGLPDLKGIAWTEELSDDALFDLLKRGDAAAARGAITHAFLNGTSLARLYDGPVAGALNRLGRLWKHGEEGIYIEHVATGICIEAINQIRMLLPRTQANAPLALGAAPEGDPYILPSLMVATMFADAGYRDVNLGPDTPANAFLKAVESIGPDLVWIAVTGHVSEDGLASFNDALLGPLASKGIEVIAGGQTASVHAHAWPSSVTLLASMEELEGHIRSRKNRA